MCHLVADCAKSDLDKLLMDAGLTRFFCNINIQEVGGVVGFEGFSPDFPLPGDKIYLSDMLDDYKVTIYCGLEIPASEYNAMLEDNVTKIIKPLLSDDLVTFNVYIYNDEHYSEIEELRENDITYTVKGDKIIYFSVKDEE